MMHMTLYWSKHVTLLVNSWNTDSWPSYLLSLLLCFFASVLLQYIEDRRLRIRASEPSQPSIATPLILKLYGGSSFAARIGSAALFGLGYALSYLLMLVVMSFNGGVLVAVVSGLSVGYFVFRAGGGDQIVAVDLNDDPCACS